MFNVELANQVLAIIEADPDSWDQRDWAVRDDCGTTFCFAGHTVALVDGPDVFKWFDEDAGYNLKSAWQLNNAAKTRIEDRAKVLLNMTNLQVDRLFYGLTQNDFNKLRELIAEFASANETEL